MSPISYKDSGVDLDLYEQAMQRLPGLMARTKTPRVMDLTGGFAGLFRLQGDGRKYEDPVLVSGTDGVGTKLKVAIAAGQFKTVGIDLVAMCVNDCLCLGAEPLFFLDYIALGKDDPNLIADLVEGVSEGCTQGGMALLGGETAIMPDVYGTGDFDMAGFAVGVAERSHLVDGSAIQPGDVAIGLAASGFHSNGYSLLRKVVFERAGLKPSDQIDALGCTVGEALLRPTTIYVPTVRSVLESHREDVHGMAHITGGGLAENIERILPENTRVTLNRSAWTPTDVDDWLVSLGHVEPDEMDRVFNRGVGFVLLVSGKSADDILAKLNGQDTLAWRIGEVQAGDKGVEIR
ncbi:phosphoribosylformylglycinamidine cyclo-ligase [Thalassoroseus pseudoceratinae]|uniref:phosphoribosylformylglycinamidine cyclo-ligase n=1 Tax=Thalassoroseus pseudoceratinae TaxID=2713176 RepID=UPI001423DF46|nr:phosphoribosylformylglycinamidine cyclo-ligase [Thalassoroseus pseudoceratinae]